MAADIDIIIARFIAEKITSTYDAHDFVRTVDLYSLFNEWCKQKQLRNTTHIVFVKELQKQGLTINRIRSPGTYKEQNAHRAIQFIKMKQ